MKSSFERALSIRQQCFVLVIAVIWVGGWGFLIYRYAEKFARFNSWFGFNSFSTPKYASFTKKLGIVEMVLAALSLVNALILYALRAPIVVKRCRFKLRVITSAKGAPCIGLGRQSQVHNPLAEEG